MSSSYPSGKKKSTRNTSMKSTQRRRKTSSLKKKRFDVREKRSYYEEPEYDEYDEESYDRPHVHHSSKKHHKRKVNRRNLWTLILVFLICCEIIAATVGMFMIGNMLQNKPEIQLTDFQTQESSHIYDVNGNQVADVGTTIRENITYDQISESVIDAFLAVEDSRFFQHDGFDTARFAAAALSNLRTHNFSQGGSTFTMQLIKLTYFQNDDTGVNQSRGIEYKVQQIALARELEKQIDKKTIFEMYLNKMNFGGTGNIRGIQKAAEYYYGKTAGELNLDEAAMLAGVINSPTYYDPHNYLDYATNRRNTVLRMMLRHGYITRKEYNLARSVKVEDTLIDPASRSGGQAYAYQSYIDTVVLEAEKLTGLDPLNTAMDIYTYMDPNVQKVMDDIQAGKYEQVQFPDDLMEIGSIVENNQTGQVIAIAGGRNYGRGGSMLLNHATAQYKQPGSSVKPFLDYALAFEYLGWATDHVVVDRPIMYTGTDRVIRNADGVYNGEVTLSYAIAASLNTPAVQCLEDVINTVGWQTVSDYISSLHFSQVDPAGFDVGYAIGGSTFVCSPEELMAAHATLMNGGFYIEPHTIARIEYRDGSRDTFTPTYEGTQVLSSQAAYLAAQLMYTAVHGSVENYMQILIRNYQTFGKTGTSDWGDEGLQYNIPEGAAKDKWMIAETSEFTIATWVGYEKGILDAGTYFTNEKSRLNIPGNISSLVLDSIYNGWAPQDLAMPAGISQITHILGTFPYAAPIDGMDPSLITTGLIKDEYNTLVEAQPAGTIDDLAEFDAALQNDGSIQIAWTPYPDSAALSESDNTMDISLYDADGNVIVEATGKKLFDWSWIYGPIRYKARISQKGDVVDLVSSETESTNEKADLAANTDTEVCGYYAYANDDSASSNEICKTFHTPAAKSTVASSNTPASDEEEDEEKTEG